MKKLFERNYKDFEISQRVIQNDSLEKYKPQIQEKFSDFLGSDLKTTPNDSKDLLQGYSVFNSTDQDEMNLLRGYSVFDSTEEQDDMDFDESSSSVSCEYRPITYQTKSQPVFENFTRFNENWKFSQLNKFSQDFLSRKCEKEKICCVAGNESFSNKGASSLESSESKILISESVKKPDLTLSDVSMSESLNESFENNDKIIGCKETTGGISSISRMISNDKSRFLEVDDSIDQEIFSLEAFSNNFPTSNNPISLASASILSDPKHTTGTFLSLGQVSTSTNPSKAASSVFYPTSSISFKTPFSNSNSKMTGNISNSIWNTTPQSPNTSIESSSDTKSNYSLHYQKDSTNKFINKESISSDWSELLEYNKEYKEKSEEFNFTLNSTYPNQATELKVHERKKFSPVKPWKGEILKKDNDGNIVGVIKSAEIREKSKKNMGKSEENDLGPVNGLNVWFFPKDNWKVEDFGEWKQGLIVDNGKVSARNIILKGRCEFSESYGLDCVLRMVECTKFSVIFELEGMKNYFNKEDLAFITKGCKFKVLNLSQKVVKMLVFQF